PSTTKVPNGSPRQQGQGRAAGKPELSTRYAPCPPVLGLPWQRRSSRSIPPFGTAAASLAAKGSGGSEEWSYPIAASMRLPASEYSQGQGGGNPCNFPIFRDIQESRRKSARKSIMYIKAPESPTKTA